MHGIYNIKNSAICLWTLYDSRIMSLYSAAYGVVLYWRNRVVSSRLDYMFDHVQRKVAKVFISSASCPFVFPNMCNNSKTAERSLMKLVIGDFHINLSILTNFDLNMKSLTYILRDHLISFIPQPWAYLSEDLPWKEYCTQTLYNRIKQWFFVWYIYPQVLRF
jgi:hypothetical protein